MSIGKRIRGLFGLYGEAGSPGRLAADSETLTAKYGRFSAEPFEVGLGKTIADSLRRALLTGLEGAAITAVRIEGVEPQFSSIPGVIEDATEIILNLKKIPFKLNASEPRTLKIFKKGPGKVTSADIQVDEEVVVLDPAVHIANLSFGGSLRMEMRLKRGRGYVPAEQNSDEDLENDYIPIDSVHTPVKKVDYTVEPSQSDRKQCEKLSIEIWTDGSVRPEGALAFAAKWIQNQMSVFVNLDENADEIRWLRSEGRHHDASSHTKYFVQPLPRRDYGCKVENLSFHESPDIELSAEDLRETIREVAQEESTARNYVTMRYRDLIDRKYLTGLSQTENEELDALTLTLEEMDKPYYETIVDRLRNLIEQR